jgi:hypothetical protein
LAIVLSVLLSVGHCVVCSSLFWPLCCLFFCLLAIVLSVLLRFTDYDYPFAIFKLFLSCPITKCHLLIKLKVRRYCLTELMSLYSSKYSFIFKLP